MERNIFFITRFSVITSTKSGSRSALSSDTIQEYRDRLMDVSLLKDRLKVFEELTLKSLLAQVKVNAKVSLIILTSDQLPELIRESLSKILIAFSTRSGWSYELCFIKSGLLPVNNSLVVEKNIDSAITRVVKEKVKNESSFVTVRLDDDDVLSSNYLPLIYEKVKPDFAGYIVTFPSGFQAIYDKKEKAYKSLKYLNYPKIALGLAHVNFRKSTSDFYDKRNHVYALGNHTSLDVENVLISDSREKVYIRTITGVNDSGNVPFHTYLPDVFLDDPCIKNFPDFINDKMLNNEGFNEMTVSDRHKHMIKSSKDYAVVRLNKSQKR
ncbi:glycosyltransferase [Vreelandella sp. EE7]